MRPNSPHCLFHGDVKLSKLVPWDALLTRATARVARLGDPVAGDSQVSAGAEVDLLTVLAGGGYGYLIPGAFSTDGGVQSQRCDNVALPAGKLTLVCLKGRLPAPYLDIITKEVEAVLRQGARRRAKMVKRVVSDEHEQQLLVRLVTLGMGVATAKKPLILDGFFGVVKTGTELLRLTIDLRPCNAALFTTRVFDELFLKWRQEVWIPTHMNPSVEASRL